MSTSSRTTSTRRRLRVYLNDHLAAATAGSALARRCLANNRGTPYEHFLADLAGQIEQDREALEDLVARLGLSRNRGKLLAAVVVERLSRLKLNGQVRGYSPLSRVVELEGLCAGVEAKRSMWRAVQEVVVDHPAVGDFPFDECVRRASRQRDELEGRRLDAAREAFATRTADDAPAAVE